MNAKVDKPVGHNAFDSLTNNGRDSQDSPTPSVEGPGSPFWATEIGQRQGCRLL